LALKDIWQSLSIYGPSYWTPTVRAKFLTQVFSVNQAIIRVLKALDWLSSISGLKVMAKSR